MINKERYLKQFGELIAEGENLLRGRTVPSNTLWDSINISEEGVTFKDFQPWKIRAINLLDSLVSSKSSLAVQIKKFPAYRADITCVGEILGTLQGCRKDFEDGFLDDLSQRIESAVAVNYLEQAEALIKEKGCAASHIPAAVLAGAVLEKALRTLCEKQIPPIKVKKSNGDFKTATPLTEDLLKMEVITPLQKKKLDVWIKIRNDAAHGNIENIRPQDVQDMITGITDFLDMMMK